MAKKHRRPVSLTDAIKNPSLIAPTLHQPSDDLGDYEEAQEAAARTEEGRGRHGFRSLIEDLE